MAGSVYVRPCFAVDGRAGGDVADAEFGGELPVGQAIGPACPQLPYFSAGQLGPRVALADGAVIITVASAAAWLESGLEVIAGRIGRRPVLGWVTAIGAGVAAGRSPGFGHAAVAHVIGGVCGLPGGPGQLVSARAGAAFTAAPDHCERPAHRAVLFLVFGRAARASARPGPAGDKRGDV